MIRAAIVGASGYAGGELLRLLLAHPRVEVTQLTSERYAGQYAHFVHPNLRDRTRLQFRRLADLEPCELLFLALPHGEAMQRIDDFAGLADRIVDLSADFRLRDPDAYPRWYGHAHAAPVWLEHFVYGAPELHRAALSDARYVAGTGCNAIVSLLGLRPLYQHDLVRTAIVDVKVGSSEGGNKASSASHHPERSGVVRTYRPTGHRHMAELIQELALDPARPDVHMTLTSVEMVRGALATAHCLLREPVEQRELWQLYRTAYGDEPFVRLVRSRRGIHRYPEPKLLAGANYCDVGFAVDAAGERVVVVSAIDNLMKGAAGGAVQCMNVMLGFPETLGLDFSGLHPI